MKWLESFLVTSLRSDSFDIDNAGMKLYVGSTIILALFVIFVFFSIFGTLGTKYGAQCHRRYR